MDPRLRRGDVGSERVNLDFLLFMNPRIVV